MDKRPDHVTFRINPDRKVKLKKLADKQKRTLSNMVALIVDEYLDAIDEEESGKAQKPKR
jgi:predicted transcriptional regulator